MAYVGKFPLTGAYQILDDISSGFNGSSDYLEVYGRLFVHSGTDSNAQFGKKVFGAFLLSTT